MSVGANIRRLREEKGLSQSYVAERAGISQAMLCQVERGTKNPSLQVGVEIARLLGCEVSALVDDLPPYGRPDLPEASELDITKGA